MNPKRIFIRVNCLFEDGVFADLIGGFEVDMQTRVSYRALREKLVASAEKETGQKIVHSEIVRVNHPDDAQALGHLL